jgi:AcrR family transcriptional regulator
MPSDSGPSSNKSRTPRKIRDVESINAEVLQVARRFFAQKTFDQVRLEDIAVAAGTSVSDIMRNFESKEGLFRKAIDQQFKLWDMMTGDRKKMGEHLAKYITAPLRTDDQVSHVLLFIKGSLGKDSKKVIQSKFASQFLEPYARWLGGEDAQTRAAILTAVMFGISFFHYICELQAFNGEEERKKIQKIMAPLIQSFIDGKP